ncbi:hypothetical protein LTR49_028908, partial [Elasticomyces elasticus]
AVIVGVGHVGATTAYTLQLQGLVSSIVLIDNHEKRAEGEARDLINSAAGSASYNIEVYAGSYKDCKDAWS